MHSEQLVIPSSYLLIDPPTNVPPRKIYKWNMIQSLICTNYISRLATSLFQFETKIVVFLFELMTNIMRDWVSIRHCCVHRIESSNMVGLKRCLSARTNTFRCSWVWRKTVCFTCIPRLDLKDNVFTPVANVWSCFRRLIFSKHWFQNSLLFCSPNIFD